MCCHDEQKCSPNEQMCLSVEWIYVATGQMFFIITYVAHYDKIPKGWQYYRKQNAESTKTVKG